LSRTRGYRNINDLRDRRLAYGGVCIRGKSSTLPNDRRCDQADVVYNKIRTVMVDDDFSRGACRTGHDWAIIEVEQPIVFDAGIRPICLPPRNPKIDRQLFIFGWGRENSLFDGSPLLRHTPMNVDARCEAPWSDHLPTNVDDYICLQSINPKNDETPRACHGDSGSGLEQRDRDLRSTLIGITSFGTKGCPRNMLARFTRVDRYLDTICEETGICYTVSGKHVKDGGDSGDDDDDRDERRQL